MNDLGEKIRVMRKSRDMTQIELAEKAGLSSSAIAMYETNRRRPKYEQLEALADAFNVPLSAFLDDDPREIKARLEKEGIIEDANANKSSSQSVREGSGFPTSNLTTEDIRAVAEYILEQAPENKPPKWLSGRIVSFGMDKVPEEVADRLLSIVRLSVSGTPYEKYFIDEDGKAHER